MARWFDRALASVGLGRLVTPGPGAAAVPSDRDALVSATVAEVRAWIDAHDRGDLQQSALFAAYATREAELLGALNQRILPLLACDTVFEPADASVEAQAEAEDLARLWPRMLPLAARADLLTAAVMLGVGNAQLVWTWDEARGELVPQADPWPAEAVHYQAWERRWYASAIDGQVEITPGDGQWLHYAPRSVYRPHQWGAIRATGEWVLRTGYAADDASKHSELHGIPVWLAELPAGARETPDGKAFVRSIRAMGRNAVVPVPQGPDKASSYNLRLEQAQTDSFRIFEFLLTRGGQKFRLAILGQDLTSVNNKVGTNASSETGRSVTEDILWWDGTTWDAFTYAQLVLPWARYRGRVHLAPRPRTKVAPDEDLKGLGANLKTFGEALLALRTGLDGSGRELDPVGLEALCRRFGLVTRLAPVAPRVLPPSPSPQPSDPTGVA